MGSSPSKDFAEACMPLITESKSESVVLTEIYKLIEKHKQTTSKERETNIMIENIDGTLEYEEQNALHVCCRSRKSGAGAIATLIDKAGFGINTPTSFGEYPIQIAVKYGSLSLIKVLMNRGCDVSVKNRRNETALMLAVNPLFVNGFQVDEASKNIHLFTRHVEEHEEIVRELLSSSTANINDFDNNGNTALHRAVTAPPTIAVRVVAEIIANRGDVSLIAQDPASNPGESPLGGLLLPPIHSTVLNRAVSYGNLGVVSLLLAGGADKNQVDPITKVTPLFTACLFHNRSLNAKQANIINTNDNQQGGKNNVRFGLDYFIFEQLGKNQQQHQALLHTLSNPPRPFWLSAEGHFKTAQVLLRNGCRPAVPEIVASCVRSLFEYAISKRLPEIAKSILQETFHRAENSNNNNQDHNKQNKRLSALAFPKSVIRAQSNDQSKVALAFKSHVKVFKINSKDEKRKTVIENYCTSSLYDDPAFRAVHRSVERTSLSKDGTYFAVSSDDSVIVFHVRTGIRIGTRHFFRESAGSKGEVIRDLAFSKSTNNILYTATAGCVLWKLTLHSDADEALTHVPNWEKAFGGKEAFDLNWYSPFLAVNPKKPLSSLISKSAAVVAVEFSPTEPKLAVAFHDPQFAVIIFEICNEVPLADLSPEQALDWARISDFVLGSAPKIIPFKQNVMAMKFSPDGQSLWATLTTRELMQIDVNRGAVDLGSKSLQTLVRDTHSDYPMALDTSESFVVTSSSYDHTCRVWSKKDQKLVCEFDGASHQGTSGSLSVNDAKFCPTNENLLVVCGGQKNRGSNSILLFNIETLAMKEIGSHHIKVDKKAEGFGAIEWSKDGNSLIALDNSGRVHFFALVHDVSSWENDELSKNYHSSLAQVVDVNFEGNDGDQLEIVENTDQVKMMNGLNN